MFFRLIYDDALAQAAYLIGCQKSGQAIVIDPERDIDRYGQIAKRHGLTIVAVAETHIHADFLSGAREFAEQYGVTVYLSDEGGADWKYRWISKGGDKPYRCSLLKHGDRFTVGSVDFEVLHTPGHTPEHLAFLVSDRSMGNGEAVGILSGDFLFVGDLGRPDLLESAVGSAGAAEQGAEALFDSLKKLTGLPEYLQVWPGHGAGSACGKALGAVPQSTIGFENRFNPALQVRNDLEKFRTLILQGQPQPPLYFARMKKLNRDGAPILGDVPQPSEIDDINLKTMIGEAQVIDARPWSEFRVRHLPGALHIPPGGGFLAIAASYVFENRPVVLVCDADRVAEMVRMLVRVGIDRIVGFISPSRLKESGVQLGEEIREVSVDEGLRLLESGAVRSLDVRSREEFSGGAIPGALNIPHIILPGQVENLPTDRPLLINCRSGMRSAVAAAYLDSRGFEVVNLAGGYDAVKKVTSFQ